MINLPIEKIVKSFELIFSITCGFVGALLLFAVIPLPGNYKLLVVQSGSMEPTIAVGSIVLTRPQEEYIPGDIVTFAPSPKEPNRFVTHRIAGFATDTFGLVYETKGDANKTVDPTTLAKENIFGKVLFIFPWVGTILHYIKTPLGFILAVIVPATIIIYEELKKIYEVLWQITHGFFSRKKRKPVFIKQDQQLLQSIERLRTTESTSFANKILIAVLGFGMSFAFIGFTQSFFSDSEIGSASIAAAAFSSPIPSISPSPLPAHIVINEVFADVDSSHGWDSPGDRGVTVGGHVTQVRVSGVGAGSTNTAFVDIETLCQVVQNNNTQVDIDLDLSGDSGDNSASGNTGGDTNIESGDVSSSVVVDVSGGNNTLGDFCGQDRGRNHEWIEIYNPTEEIVNLKNWTITDNSGISVTIHGNKFLGPGKFALISKSNSTWNYWDEPTGVLKIALGRQIGDGLDDGGDHLVLKDPDGQIEDALSYGDDVSEFVLTQADLGHSLERVPDGIDTNTQVDWNEQFLPSPGT